MATRESSQSIDAAAADWVARRDRRALTDEEEAAFQSWLAQDSRRPGALLRAQAIYKRSEAAIAMNGRFDPDDFRDADSPPAPPALSRRRLLSWGGGTMAATLAGVILFNLDTPAAYATARGERRLVRLEDGSTIFLNTETRVTVRYRDGERTATLDRGEALFTVRKNARRPFKVEAGTARLSTEGADFRVRLLADKPADILVSGGEVRVHSDSSGRDAPIPLYAGMALVLVGRTVAPVRLTKDDIGRDLAWREGKIAFEGESLAQAAANFARYGDPRIEIRDAALGREPVTGLFAANDPAGFSQAVASIFGARLTREGATIILSRDSAKKI